MGFVFLCSPGSVDQDGIKLRDTCLTLVLGLKVFAKHPALSLCFMFSGIELN